MFVIDKSTLVDLNKGYTVYRMEPFYYVIHIVRVDVVFSLASFQYFYDRGNTWYFFFAKANPYTTT
jgi:hypothetical protein